MGVAIIALVFGWQVLWPWNTGWMLEGTIGPDPVQYWLGYTYFARSPWTLPPGANPDWGLEIASAVFYSDSIPLLAFLFKAVHPLVEVPQYWGMWMFACGGLQALLAFRLIGLATRDPLARIAGGALFVVQPILLNRLGGHFALGGQFLLLAALYLCLAPSSRWRWGAWMALVLAASLIHSYLLPMVAGLWATDWLARLLSPSPARRDRVGVWVGFRALEAVAVPAIGIAGLWAAGFFLLSAGLGGTWGGYGAMQLDLLAPFDPAPWGGLLPDLPNADHLEAQDSYLGVGSLLLLVAGVMAWAWRAQNQLPDWGRGQGEGEIRREGGVRNVLASMGPWPPHKALSPGGGEGFAEDGEGFAGKPVWPLIAGLLLMLAIAITHRVTLGGSVIAILAEPSDGVLALASALRASVRFFWPIAYAALFFAIAACARVWGGRRTGLLLAACLAAQVVDLNPGFARLARYFPAAPATAPLRLADPFWLEATTRYARIRLTPTGMQARHWEEVAVLAATRGLPTDAVYLARLDPDRVAALNARTLERLAAGDFEPGSLYVLGDSATQDAARRGHDPARDLLAPFDGLLVLAPNWRSTHPITGPPPPTGTARGESPGSGPPGR